MKSRKKIIFACGFAILAMGLLFCLYGYDQTWKLWNIPTMSPHFADLRGLLACTESRAQGFDTMLNNPRDPWQRKLNYPRIWQSLYLFGADQSHTTALGIAVILLFLSGICLILPHAGNAIIVAVMAAVLSPATLLGIERANTDLLMFFLIAISIATVKRWHFVSTATVLLAFILKIFPIFGSAVLLRTSRFVFFRYVFMIVAFVALYAVLTYADLLLINEANPHRILLTYGLNVFWMAVRGENAAIGESVRYLSYLTVLLSLLFALTALFRNDFQAEERELSVYLDAFRAGTAIYLGTFLLNSNWDHRLIFLIFTIPQLVIWSKSPVKGIAAASIAALASTFLSMWHLLIVKIVYNLPYGGYVSYTLDKTFHWILFTGLLYLFFWTIPDWLKEYARKMRSLTHATEGRVPK